MSIANKLIYLNDTKEKLKDSINNIGGSITDETTFRAYAEELDNIYTNLPKTTGEGSNLSLTTLKGRINVDDILGDTQQDKTNGYNIWGGVSFINNKISTNADGSFSISLNNEPANPVTTTVAIENNLVKTLPAGTYTFSGTNLRGNIPAHLVKVTGTTGQVIQQIDTSTNSVTFTTTEEISYFIRLQAVSNVTYTGTTYIQLEPGTTAHTWEPYTNGASPNPTYPQDINVVTGTQEVVVENANLLDMSLLTTISGNRYISSGSNHIKVAPNTTYTFSVKSSTGADGLITIYDKNGTQTQTISQSQASRTSATFTTGANDSYLIINRWYIDSTAISVASTEPMLNVGSTATSYVEHQEQTKTLHLGDIELAKIGTYQDRIYKNNDKWYIEKKIGHKKASEITTNDIGGTGGSQSVYFIPSFTNVMANRTLQVYSNVQTWKNSVDTEWDLLNGNYIGVLFNVQQIYINKTASTKSELITWLNSINFEMYYVLATPTYTEITNETLQNELNELEKMMSYNGQTNISVSGNLPMMLDITALKGE